MPTTVGAGPKPGARSLIQVSFVDFRNLIIRSIIAASQDLHSQEAGVKTLELSMKPKHSHMGYKYFKQHLIAYLIIIFNTEFLKPICIIILKTEKWTFFFLIWKPYGVCGKVSEGTN